VSLLTTSFNLLEKGGLEALRYAAPERLEYHAERAVYLNLRGAELAPLPEIQERIIANLCRFVRGLIFAAVDGAKSGHPGGSSSKTEQVVTLLASGVVGFDARHPKHPGRDRVVWSAGHCSPLSHALVALVYDVLRREEIRLQPADATAALYPEQLAAFRTINGPSGHVESHLALADTSTGSPATPKPKRA
jgi:transketolase